MNSFFLPAPSKTVEQFCRENDLENCANTLKAEGFKFVEHGDLDSTISQEQFAKMGIGFGFARRLHSSLASIPATKRKISQDQVVTSRCVFRGMYNI